MPDASAETAAPKRKRPWIQVSILSVGIVVVLGLVAGLVLMPRLFQRHHLDNLLSADVGSDDYASAVNYWASKVSGEGEQRDRFVELWWSLRDDPDDFVRLSRPLVQADLVGEMPEPARIRYHRYTAMAAGDVESRRVAAASLVNFSAGGEAGDELAAAIDTALADASDEVASEAAFVLPTWSTEPWAVRRMSQALSDKRAAVRERAVRAAGVVALSLPETAVGRAARLAMRNRLVTMALDPNETGAVRASAAWGLWRFRWLAQSAQALGDPRGPLELRRMAPLMMSNMPIPEDHSGPELGQGVLIGQLTWDDDPLVQTRAALGLTMLAGYGGLPMPMSEAGYEKLLASRRWPSIALAARLIGLTRDYRYLDELQTIVLLPDRPDVVSEQVAFALGELAVQPYAYQDSEQLEKLRGQARTALAALADPELLPATQPDAAPMAPTPRTRLAVAAAWGRLGDIGPLTKLAGRQIAPPDDEPISPETLADLAALELARLADADPELHEKIRDAARSLAGQFEARARRSGAMLIGLLGDTERRDTLLADWRDSRAAGEDKLTHIYMQAALHLMGVAEVNEQVPVTAWLAEPAARTPGIYALLVRAGEIDALADLFAINHGPDRQLAIDIAMDEWHLRRHVNRWLGGGPIADLPAADPALVDFHRKMSAWWFKVHRHRLEFDPEQHVWTVRGAPELGY